MYCFLLSLPDMTVLDDLKPLRKSAPFQVRYLVLDALSNTLHTSIRFLRYPTTSGRIAHFAVYPAKLANHRCLLVPR
jgi:hypothetical protein